MPDQKISPAPNVGKLATPYLPVQNGAVASNVTPLAPVQAGDSEPTANGAVQGNVLETPEWPMDIDDFLKGRYLSRADVLLLSKVGSLKGWLIRWAISSHFTHAALMFLVPRRELGYDNHYMIESTPHGVGLASLYDFVGPRKHPHIVAIKRFEREWFDPLMRNRVSGQMLNYIKSDYDFTKAGMLGVKFRSWGFNLTNALFGKSPSVKRLFDKGRHVPAQFICSGFVQYGFAAVIQSLVKQKRLPKEAFDHCLFADTLNGDSTVEELLTVSPTDISHCDNLNWKYVMFKGLVYPVSSKDEAFKLIRQLV